MLKQVVLRLRHKLGFSPKPVLASKKALIDYTQKQAAYVSQTTLYGYVRTRAGTSWPKLFNNETYLISLRTARWHIYAACVADLAQFLAARVFINGGIKENQAKQLADEICQIVLTNTEQEDVPQSAFDEVIALCQESSDSIDWTDAAQTPSTFQSSSDAFMRWAPMADQFKEQDEEIMRNSIHMRWIGIRREVKETLDASPIISELE